MKGKHIYMFRYIYLLNANGKKKGDSGGGAGLERDL